MKSTSSASILLLPMHLYDRRYLDYTINEITGNIKNIYLYEHPHYFIGYRYNKKDYFFTEHQ